MFELQIYIVVCVMLSSMHWKYVEYDLFTRHNHCIYASC